MEKNSIRGFRLSPLQQRMWMQDSPAFHAQCAILLEGKLNPAMLKRALQQVIAEHEILRTTLHLRPGLSHPFQVIADDASLLWQEINLSTSSREQQGNRVADLLREQREQPFHLSEGPLLRVLLLMFSEHEHVLLVDMPAYLADARTLENLVRELGRFYTGSSQGENPEQEPTQYVQFSEWRNTLFEEEGAEEGRDYWRKQFSVWSRLVLPFENRLGNAAQFEVESLPIRIEPATVARIAALARQYDASVAAYLLAVWQTLLWRLSGQVDIVVGYMCDGRQLEDLTNAMGLFADCLPLYVHIEGQLRFSEVLGEVHAAMQRATEWQEYFIYENIIKVPESFESIGFEFQQWPPKEDAGDISLSLIRRDVCPNRFKMKLHCSQKDEDLSLEWQYNLRVYSTLGMRHLTRQFQTLLESSSRSPEATMSELEIMGRTELQRLYSALNNTGKDYDQQTFVHQLFAEQVERSPGNVAIVCEEQQLTYADLNKRSNQLAHYLRAVGVGPEVIVAMCVERSLDMIVGLLGVLKAGGAYVPLEPLLPQERLAYMLDITQARVLLTQERLVPLLPVHHTQLLCLDKDWPSVATCQTANPPDVVTGANLAYILFTSGSTGTPKAVAVEHRQIAGYLRSILEKLDLPLGASYAMVSTFAADLGNTVIYPALGSGGCLYVLSQDQVSDPKIMTEYLHAHPVDCLKIVPFHLRALLQSAHSENILPKRRLVLGGEAVTWELFEQIQAIAPACSILNHYGPTESTVGALTYEIEKDNAVRYSATVPIGRPLANTRAYLLDAQLQPVPPGVPGELYVGGVGIARGYLNDARLTAEKFVPDPFAEEPGERLYRTGDLARYLPDDTIEFLGRTDYQVKIRGFRIELGEIEVTLEHQAPVREAVVTMREDVPGQKRLIAYIVPAQGQEITSSDLRTSLKRSLPEYMLPATFVFLKALPLTSNGKVDRRALPAPDQVRSVPEKGFVAPETAIEKTLAEIWTQALGNERIGIHDKFFELGGDSILCIQVIAKASQVGLRLTPRQLFQYQTIAELADVIEIGNVIEAEQGPVTGPVPLTPIQRWFFEQQLPDPHYFNQALLLTMKQEPDPHLLEQAIQELLTHHDALRMRFVGQDQEWRQVITEPGGISLSVIDLSGVAEAEQSHAIEEKSTALQERLNLSVGPLVSCALFMLGGTQPSRLLLIIHHLIVDGVSWRILLEDLQLAYEQLSQGKAVELPAKTTSFKQWSEKLIAYAQSDLLAQELNYWFAECQNQVPQLPVDNVRGRNTVAQARTITLTIDAEETDALLHKVPEVYHVQINDVLLTALLLVFQSWTGNNALFIELEGHGREEILEGVNVTRTVGWFTIRFPVLLTLSTQDIGVPDRALKSVKEQLRRIPRRGIGYGLLRYLNRDAAMSKQIRSLAQPEISFNYLGQFDQALQTSSSFGVASESSGANRSPNGNRVSLLEINGFIIEKQLQLEWMYSEEIYRHATVERLAQDLAATLQSLIAHCLLSEAGGYTPSDFQAARLSQAELDQFLASMGQSGEEPTR